MLSEIKIKYNKKLYTFLFLFFSLFQVYKTPFQRILYRSQDKTTFSSLEMYPHSQILLDVFQTHFINSINILCEVSILHIYHKNVQQKIMLDLTTTTVKPNLLGLEANKINGDPDNSPLTGLAIAINVNNKCKIFLLTFFLLFIRFNLL